jgi:hypothetical protein
MKELLLWLAGYRKYTFPLYNGNTITFHSKTSREAIKKALNYEHKARLRELKCKANQAHIVDALIKMQDVPNKLVGDVLRGMSA